MTPEHAEQSVWTRPIPSHYALWLAIGFSFVVHAALFSLHFSFPDLTKTLPAKALDIALVNNQSARAPHKAQVLAQANLDGGGTLEEDRRAKTPLPTSHKNQRGSDVEKAQKQLQQLEAEQKRLLSKAQSRDKIAPPVNKATTEKMPTTPSGFDLQNNALEMARLQGAIDQRTEEYNRRPQLKTLGISALKNEEAAYLYAWERKVEKIGTLNYPQAARGKLYGSVTVWVVLAPDGSLKTLELQRSSGQKELDQAALRIIEMGAPYSAIPSKVLGKNDLLGFARRLNFTRSDELQAGK